MKDIYDIAAELKNRAGQRLALATLVRAQGSSYRRPGARLLICQDGSTIGSLSGGCIEDEIAARAQSVLRSGAPLLMDFDTRRRFGCHGKIDIFIERIDTSWLADVADYLDRRRCCVVTTVYGGDSNQLGTCLGTVDCPAGNCLTQEIHPPIRLLMLGDGPDSAPFQDLCELLGWRAVQIDDPRGLAIAPDDWTAAIVKSHNFGRDFVALGRLLPLKLRYVGLIGPKKRRDQLVNELLEIDVPMNAGFFAPAGLDLNAETPEEIALTVVSEIQRVFADGSGQSLRDRKQPIHHDSKTARSDVRSGWQTLGL